MINMEKGIRELLKNTIFAHLDDTKDAKVKSPKVKRPTKGKKS